MCQKYKHFFRSFDDCVFQPICFNSSQKKSLDNKENVENFFIKMIGIQNRGRQMRFSNFQRRFNLTRQAVID